MQITGNVDARRNGVPIMRTKQTGQGVVAYAAAGRTNTQQEAVKEQTVEQETYTPSKEAMSACAQDFMDRINRAGEGLMKLTKQGDKNPFEDQARAMRIALNMMRGKQVPPQDEKFLMQFDDELYQAAKNIQMMKKRKEDAESELEDDDDSTSEKIRKLALDNAGEKLVDSFDHAGAAISDTTDAPDAAEVVPAAAGDV